MLDASPHGNMTRHVINCRAHEDRGTEQRTPDQAPMAEPTPPSKRVAPDHRP